MYISVTFSFAFFFWGGGLLLDLKHQYDSVAGKLYCPYDTVYPLIKYGTFLLKKSYLVHLK